MAKGSSKIGGGSTGGNSNTKEIIFMDDFNKRSHAEVVDIVPEGLETDKRYQGEIDGYKIYSLSSLRDDFGYIAVKPSNKKLATVMDNKHFGRDVDMAYNNSGATTRAIPDIRDAMKSAPIGTKYAMAGSTFQKIGTDSWAEVVKFNKKVTRINKSITATDIFNAIHYGT